MCSQKQPYEEKTMDFGNQVSNKFGKLLATQIFGANIVKFFQHERVVLTR
jgi:hypothetical protein